MHTRRSLIGIMWDPPDFDGAIAYHLVWGATVCWRPPPLCFTAIGRVKCPEVPLCQASGFALFT